MFLSFSFFSSLTGYFVWGRDTHYRPHIFPKSAFIFSLTDWIKDRLGEVVCLVLDAYKLESHEKQKNIFNKYIFLQIWPGSWYSKHIALSVTWWKLLIVHPDSGLKFVTGYSLQRTTGTRCLISETFGQSYWLVRPLRTPSCPLSPWPISYHRNDKGMEMKENWNRGGGRSSACIYAKYMQHQQKRVWVSRLLGLAAF